MTTLPEFVEEILWIDGRSDDETPEDAQFRIDAAVPRAQTFLSKTTISIADLEDLHLGVNPKAERIKSAQIRGGLDAILEVANRPQVRAMAARLMHLNFMSLAPFGDDSGFAGRMLWLWCVGGLDAAPRGFLHALYAAELASHRRRVRT